MHMAARANNIKEHGGGARLLDVSPSDVCGDILSTVAIAILIPLSLLSSSGLVEVFSLYPMKECCQREMSGGCDCDGRCEARGVSESTSNCDFEIRHGSLKRRLIGSPYGT
jgi:hypothetical protein